MRIEHALCVAMRERKREMEGREREIDSNDSDVTCEFYKMKPNEMAEKKKKEKKNYKKTTHWIFDGFIAIQGTNLICRLTKSGKPDA